MNSVLQLLLEAFCVGVSVLVYGTIISYIIAKIMEENTSFLRNKSMYIGLFVVGFTIHISFELFGINKWYCNNSVACNNNSYKNKRR